MKRYRNKIHLYLAVTFFIAVVSALCSFASDGWPILSPEIKEKKVQQYITPVVVELENIRIGGNPDPRIVALADSAAHYIYEDAEGLGSFYTMYCPLYLENYNRAVRDTVCNWEALAGAVRMAGKVKKFHDMNLLDGTMALCEHHAMAGGYPEAAGYLDLAFEIKNSLPENEMLTLSLSMLGSSVYSLAARKESSLACCRDFSAIIRKYGQTATPEYKENLLQMIELESEFENFGAVDSLVGEAEKLIPVSDELYPDLLSSMSTVADRTDTEQTFRWMERAIEYAESHPGCSSVIRSYQPLFRYLGADDSLIPRVLAVFKRDRRDDDFASVAGYAAILWSARRYDESAKWIANAERLAGKMIESRRDPVQTVLTMASLYAQTGNARKAVSMLNERMPMINSEFGNVPWLIADVYALWADILTLSGEYRKAFEVLDMIVADGSLSEETRTKALVSKAGVYNYMHNYEAALEVLEDLLTHKTACLTRQKIADLKIDRAGALLSLLDTRHDKNDEESAKLLERLRAAVADFGDGNGLKLETRVEMLLSAAGLAMVENDRTTMLSCVEEASRLLSSARNKRQTATHNSMLALYYFNAGCNERAIELVEKDSGEPDLDMVEIYDGMIRAEAYLAKGDMKKAQKSFSEVCSRELDMIRRNFGRLTSDERSRFWRSHSRNISNAGRFCRNGEQSEYTEMLYDLALYGKGLMMVADNAFERAVERSANREALEQLALYRQLHHIISSNTSFGMERKDAVEKMNALELEMMRLVPEASRMVAETERMSWKEVKERLAPHDAAIEFLELEGPNMEREYAAVVVTGSSRRPVFVRIGDENAIRGMVDNGFDGAALWNSLLKYMHTDGKTYFAAAGILNNLPVESLLVSGEPVSFSYPLYRLSSTRELLRQREAAQGKTVVIGNIDYDRLPDTPEIESPVPEESGSGSGNTRRSVTREAGGGVAPLPATEKEINEIYRICGGKDADVALLSETGASESAFRSIPSGEIGMLHIATHGYYLPSGSDGGDMIPSLMQLAGNTGRNSDEGLLNSGLLMAGANVEREVTDGDDSLLTAMEISQMDFSNASLVALSACESGRGDVGVLDVYGLQRGFKMAGAGTLLISLRPVYDRETSELMIAFYDNLSGGMTKREALEAAKRKLRSANPDPAVWAPFILLDALD